ncbi:MAG: M1 family peptidase, partial [Calditrichaeota bacterium]
MKFSIHLCWIWFLMTILLSGGIAQISNFPNPPILFDPPMSPRIANYEINVRLIPEDRRLEGQQILTWKNTSDDEISELQFHLYLNAFRNSKSTFMIESGGVHRGFQLSEEGWGYIELNEIFLLPEPNSDLTHPMLPRLLAEETIKGEDLLPTMEYIHPDNPEHIHDKTVIRLQLPRSLAPGEAISLFFDFTAKLPEPPFARTGAKEEYFFVGQWFPKIGVYTDTGWNCHQFHRNSEFFADYGVYNVWITVPAENILGATGLPVSDPIINDDGTATHFYHAEDVHDFAWTTSPEYVEFTGKVQDVDIRVLMQPDHKDQGPRHIAAAKVAISHFQDWYGDYPFPNLTVVDPRRGAKGSGGMEYPTLITAGTIYGIPEGIRPVEMVIIHEFGHNYWYHLLASNEFEESWMDEGINTYTEIQIMNDAYGPVGDMFDFLGIRLNDLQLNRMQYLSGPDYDPVLKKAWEFYSSRSYGINSYARPGITLTTLQNYLGWDKMLEIMRT